MFSLFTAGKSFRIMDSIDVRKAYNLQQSLTNITVVDSIDVCKEYKQQPLSNITNQVQSPASMNEHQYLQSSIVNNLEPATLNMNQLSVSEEFSSKDSNFNTDFTAKITSSSKTKRRKISGDIPRGINLFSLCFLLYYYILMLIAFLIYNRKRKIIYHL